MFPDMEAEEIEAVLIANSGSVDATIDQLLAMTNDNNRPDVEASRVVRYEKHQFEFTNS